MGRKRIRQGKHLYILIACVILACLCGCSGFQELLARPDYWQAHGRMAARDFSAALKQYRQIAELYPQVADEAFFGIGCIYAHARYPERDYGKSIEAFRKVVSDFPQSRYREHAEAFMAVIGDVSNRNSQVATQNRQIEMLEQQVESLQKQLEQLKEIDRSLEERRRQLSPFR